METTTATTSSDNHFYYHSEHHHQEYPELEQLAKTMPKPFIGYGDVDNFGDVDDNDTDDDDDDDCDFNDLNKTSATTTTTIRSQSRMSISHDKGLLNMPGQNNCFLNSAVQVLWHLDIFRRSFRELQGHACMGDSCIFCALKELFNQFQCSTKSALPPDSLRFALSQSFNDQRKFRLGYMDDAAECFENILYRIHYHITNKEIDNDITTCTNCLPHCISHEKFSMNLYEQINCYSCGATSIPFKFSQMVHYISTSALCSASTNSNDKAVKNFGKLIKMANSMGDIRNCPKMCGAKMNIEKKLLNKPDIISIGLVWDNDHPSLTHIRNVYQLIDTTITLNEMFNLNDNSINYQLNLVGLVTYYGKHYSTYIFNTKLSKWLYFDDANVRIIGSKWQQVVDKCIRGHFQPLLLLYSNPMAKIIDTNMAMNDIVPMTIMNNNNKSNNLMNEEINQEFKKIQKESLPLSTVPPPIPPHNYSTTKTMIHQQPKLPRRNVAHNYNSDVPPDSPSATSTTSYFSSDLGGDSTDGYISRKIVENIIKIQQRQRSATNNKDNNTMMNQNNYNNRKYNRNSSSSLESFDSVVLRNHSKLFNTNQKSNNNDCLLKRRDSDNSNNSDRASSSASSNDQSYHYNNQRIITKNSRNSTTTKNISDQGYDSFSLSSSDSYPSTISPSKMNNNRLKQIPEDDNQLIEMVNTQLTIMNECDKLCSEADVLLLRSHEKEREGDLRAAAALSDSAAAKARLAMDIPYSNHQTLISAKMKHSMCVMRSASLHKRLMELDQEEKRLLKAAAIESGLLISAHSRQSSRDSNNYGKHSRQSSRDNKDTTATANKTQINNKQDNLQSLEIYATLPKKLLNSSTKIKSKSTTNDNIKSIDKSIDNQQQQSIYENVPPILPLSPVSTPVLPLLPPKPPPKSSNFINNKAMTSDSEFSDYYYYDIINDKKKQQSNDNDKQQGGELMKKSKSNCKNKVKRKLLFNNLYKTKNQSLPDLREELYHNDAKDDNCDKMVKKSVAKINSKGFHQIYRSSFIDNDQCTATTKPLLLKVKPPDVTNVNSMMKPDAITIPKPIPNRKEKPIPPKRNLFLEELNKKRTEIMKSNNQSNHDEIYSNVPRLTKMIGPTPVPVINNNNSRKPNMLDITNLITKNSPPTPPSVASSSSSSATIHMPIPINPMINPQIKPPDYETTLKRLQQQHQQQQQIYTNLLPQPLAMTMGDCKNSIKTSIIKDEMIKCNKNNDNNSNSNSNNCNNISNKKSVKFSDQIELVDLNDNDDDHLPNLLLEKILGGNKQNIVYTLHK